MKRYPRLVAAWPGIAVMAYSEAHHRRVRRTNIVCVSIHIGVLLALVGWLVWTGAQ